MATPSDCEALNGIITAQDYCDQLMCCNTADGPQMVPFLDCAFADLNWEPGACDLEPQLVCCQAGTLPSYVSEATCDEQGGLIIGDDCAICCAVGDDTSYINASTCAEQSGDIVGPILCQVCCQFGGGATQVPAEFCLAGGGFFVDDSVCDPPPDEMVCCALGDETSYIWLSECTGQGGSVAGPTECQVCCEYPGGGIGQDPATFCMAGGGTVVDDSLCEPADEMICCQVGDNTSHIWASECSSQGGTTVDLQDCKVCCKNPNGNGPEYVFEEDCDQLTQESDCQPPGGM